MKNTFSSRSKFKNMRVVCDNINFSSGLERDYYLLLKKQKEIGLVSFYLRQVPFHLPGKVKYYLDFMVFYENIENPFIEYVDTKGKRTPMYIMKKKQVEELYPIKITEISRNCLVEKSNNLYEIINNKADGKSK